MRKKRQIFQLLLIAGLLFIAVPAFNKTDKPIGDSPSAGIVIDADGNKYNTVRIGNQVWTVENLKTTKYNNGTPIPNVTDNNTWVNLSTGAYCNYDNLAYNATTYGRLYNWYAVNTGKLAPVGWHVPTNDDWAILVNYLIDNGFNYDGTYEGDKIAKSLCAKTHWSSDFLHPSGSPVCELEKNNSSGFTALPGGRRNDFPIFDGIEGCGYWWSSSYQGGNYAYVRILGCISKDFARGYFGKIYGFSVRLVKD